MKPWMVHSAVLIVVSAAVFFTHLGTAHLWDRDEPRNAGCAAEMMQRGDWVVPTFNDELRHQKPVLLYWLMMSAYSLFGQTEFAARFWSAMLAVGTVLATSGIATRLTNPMVGLVSGLILATSLMFGVAARAATPDSLLIFCNIVAIWLYVSGTVAPRRGDDPIRLRTPDTWFPQNVSVVIAFYVMLGLGVLTKGPVGFLLPMAMIGWFGLIQRLPEIVPTATSATDFSGPKHWYWAALSNWIRPFQPNHFLKTLWAMRPLTGAWVVIMVAAPWYCLVDARTDGDFTKLFFIGEHFGRATTALENHSGGFWFYPLAILIGFFPWSVFWGPVAMELVMKRNQRSASVPVAAKSDSQPVAATTFLQSDCGSSSLTNSSTGDPLEVLSLCMIAVQVGVFSIAQTKLPSYVTPCYPALAMLTAACLVKWVEGRSVISSRWFAIAFGSMSVGGGLIAIGLGIAAKMFVPNQTWLIFIGLVPLIGGGVAVWRLLLNQRRQTLVVAVSSSIVFCILLFGFGTTAIDSIQQTDTVLEPIIHSPGQRFVASYRTLESSWVYYAGQPIFECREVADPSMPADLNRRNWWDAKPRLTPEALVRLKPQAMFLTTDEHLNELKQRLPADYQVIRSADYFLKNKKILLLRRCDDRLAMTNGLIESR